uniref:Uncharacterized protein n=1 Tax=Timema poppense TaxID=170557 RepID=A0A7R9HIK2_TIMPO|nr:unnamed protein product [Timema poppensis]
MGEYVLGELISSSKLYADIETRTDDIVQRLSCGRRTGLIAVYSPGSSKSHQDWLAVIFCGKCQYFIPRDHSAIEAGRPIARPTGIQSVFVLRINLASLGTDYMEVLLPANMTQARD